MTTTDNAPKLDPSALAQISLTAQHTAQKHALERACVNLILPCEKKYHPLGTFAIGGTECLFFYRFKLDRIWGTVTGFYLFITKDAQKPNDKQCIGSYTFDKPIQFQEPL